MKEMEEMKYELVLKEVTEYTIYVTKDEIKDLVENDCVYDALFEADSEILESELYLNGFFAETAESLMEVFKDDEKD